MDVIEMTRKLGEEIQKDDRYIAFAEAKKGNEADVELNTLIEELNKIQETYQVETQKEEADQDALKKLDDEFRDVYMKVMSNENMKAYEAARQGVDDMMNHVMKLLSLMVNGEDPKTVEVPAEPEGCSPSACANCASQC